MAGAEAASIVRLLPLEGVRAGSISIEHTRTLLEAALSGPPDEGRACRGTGRRGMRAGRSAGVVRDRR